MTPRTLSDTSPVGCCAPSGLFPSFSAVFRGHRALPWAILSGPFGAKSTNIATSKRTAPVPSTANPSRCTIAGNQAVPAEYKARRARFVFRGQVVDPEGKPVVGAQLLLALPSAGTGVFPAPQPLGTSGRDGRFEVSIAHESIDPAAGQVFMPARQPAPVINNQPTKKPWPGT